MNADKPDPRTHAIIGAAMEVHRQLGYGFLEAVYQEALVVELKARGIPFEREALLAIHYKDQILPCVYRADLICYGDILVELKALSAIGGRELAQVLNYLKASGLRLGLILNFGSQHLQMKRVVLDPSLCQSASSEDDSTFELEQ